MTTVEYRIAHHVSNTSRAHKEFEEIVNKMINFGFQPLGGVSVSIDARTAYYYFAQAMQKTIVSKDESKPPYLRGE
jgi:hypothetical protein